MSPRSARGTRVEDPGQVIPIIDESVTVPVDHGPRAGEACTQQLVATPGRRLVTMDHRQDATGQLQIQGLGETGKQVALTLGPLAGHVVVSVYGQNAPAAWLELGEQGRAADVAPVNGDVATPDVVGDPRIELAVGIRHERDADHRLRGPAAQPTSSTSFPVTCPPSISSWASRARSSGKVRETWIRRSPRSISFAQRLRISPWWMRARGRS